jgi:hypothetical protein
MRAALVSTTTARGSIGASAFETKNILPFFFQLPFSPGFSDFVFACS